MNNISFLDSYFDITNDEFNNIHLRNKNIVHMIEDDSFINIEFTNNGENINIIYHTNEDFMYFLDDKNLIDELYLVIKLNYKKENWLLILMQIIFDLTYIKDYSSLQRFIKDHIYKESIIISKNYELDIKE